MGNKARYLTPEQLQLALEIQGKSENYKKLSDCNRYRIRLSDELWSEIQRGTESIPKEPKAAIKRLFFDIETSPMLVYSWRIGNKISLSHENIVKNWGIITICYKWEFEDEVHSLTWDNQNDKEILKDFIKIALQADEMIGHNGDRFDIKKIRTRCIYHRIPMMPKYRTLDTLKKSRGSFYFDSNKLDYIGEYLGLGRKMQHEGFSLWIKCLNNDEKALDTMVEYCMRDVVLLEDVYHALEHYIKPNTHAGVHNGLPKWSCPICASESVKFVKTDVTQKGTLSRVVQCDDCGQVYNINNKAYMDYLQDLINQ